MGRSKHVFWITVAAVFLSYSAVFAFQNTGGGRTARVTKQQFLSESESQAMLQRSAAWEKFKQDFGEKVRVVWNVNSGTPHRIVTTGLKFVQNLDDSNIKSVSDDFIDEYSGLLGVDPSDLRLQTAGFRGRMWYVIYDRYYNGLPVYNAMVRLTYHSNGNLVSCGSDTYPGIKLDTTPQISETQAVDIVRREVGSTSFEDKVLNTRLLVLPLEIGNEYSVHLAWEIEFYTVGPLARWFMYVDAHDGEVLMYWDAIAYAFTGNVNGDVQLNGAYDNFVNLPFKDLTVNAGGHGSDVTDVNGNYSISGSGSATITAQLSGPFVNVDRWDGGDASFSSSSSGSLNIDWTSISQPQERDAYYHTIVVHDYIKYVDPSFTGMDFQLPCSINVAGSCNAYWDGSSINFYAAGGGCPNIAQMPTVVYHEYGHGITENFYYPVNLPYWDETGGMHEGWSDFIANCITDQPLEGRGWSGPGTYLRSSDNTAQYPGSGCGGEPHCMGDILVGALWDMRVNLVNTHGNSIKPYVDSLWHYARYAKPLTYLDYLWELLLYDDDNGNPLDGTPNYYDICDGFAQHNMDCPELQIGVFITHTPLDNTPSTSDYQVDADIYSTEGSITGADLYYSTGGGYTPAAMTNIGGDNWRGYIPGQSLCTTIDYYIEASDNMGYSSRKPETGSNSFFIGYTNVMFSDDVESGMGSWTHYAVSGSVDEWAIRNHRNHTTGGSNAWKLGSSFSDSNYADYQDAGLVSPSTYISTGAELTFWMWGDIEQSSSTSAWDGALVEISLNGGGFTQLTPTGGGYTHTGNGWNSWPSGTPCWSGSFGWTRVTCDLSSYANNNVRIRFRFSSDSYVAYEGWYIDDFEITSVDCLPQAIGTLSGTVTDAEGPLGGVTVFANDGQGHIGSDLTLGDGTYSMDIRASTYDVSFSHPLYTTVNFSGVAVIESTNTTQNAYMVLLPQPEIDVSPTSLGGHAPAGGSDADLFSISNMGDSSLIFQVYASIGSIVPLSAKRTPDISTSMGKPKYTGKPNVPDQNVILQGGDNIASATVIPSLPYTNTGTTSGYIDDYDEVCPYQNSTSPDVVYAYTAPANGIFDITLCNGSDYDTKLYIYENSYTPGSPYACNDDECPGYVSELIGLPLTGGNTYYIVIDGYAGDYGNYVLEMSGTFSSWLSVDINEGTILPGGPAATVTAALNAAALTEGTYNGTVHVSSNDPDESVVDIPVTFIVGTQITGQLQGTVTDSSGPVEGVQVFANNGSGGTGSDVTLSDGSYSMTLGAGTYSVNFSHLIHRDTTVTGVTVAENDTTILDVQMEGEEQPTIPTLNEWGMIILSLLLLGVGTIALIRRRNSVPGIVKKRIG
jgi:hypothetical protein